MRSKALATAALAALTLPSCMTTNLVGWANTRDEPIFEHLRIQAATLLILPALAGDVVLSPIQVLARMQPYGDLGWQWGETDKHPRSAEDERYLRATEGK